MKRTILTLMMIAFVMSVCGQTCSDFIKIGQMRSESVITSFLKSKGYELLQTGNSQTYTNAYDYEFIKGGTYNSETGMINWHDMRNGGLLTVSMRSGGVIAIIQNAVNIEVLNNVRSACKKQGFKYVATSTDNGFHMTFYNKGNSQFWFNDVLVNNNFTICYMPKILYD